jgi:anti-sigma factor RsiW
MTTHDEMTCRELVDVITDYLEGKLSQRDRDRFEAHIEECPYCLTYLEQMRETIATLGALGEESLSGQTRERLIEAFGDWRGAA